MDLRPRFWELVVNLSLLGALIFGFVVAARLENVLIASAANDADQVVRLYQAELLESGVLGAVGLVAALVFAVMRRFQSRWTSVPLQRRDLFLFFFFIQHAAEGVVRFIQAGDLYDPARITSAWPTVSQYYGDDVSMWISWGVAFAFALFCLLPRQRLASK